MAETTPTMLPDRALLRLAGDNVREFLQGLVTSDVAALNDAHPVWAGLLTPQGKALFDFILWADGDAVLIDCEADQAAALAKRLMLYRLRRAITIEPAPGTVHWSLSADRGTADPRLADLGHRWIDQATGAPAPGWREHRLRLGITEGVNELGSGETLWLECNAAELNGVSFGKGCYIGQENTARMHYRAKVNRRLVIAPLGDPEDRDRIAYPELGLKVTLRRTDSLGDALMPSWLRAAIA